MQTVRDVEQSAVARLVLTNDSASTWFNLKMGLETTAQRYRQTYQATPETAALNLGFDEQRTAAFAGKRAGAEPPPGRPRRGAHRIFGPAKSLERRASPGLGLQNRREQPTLGRLRLVLPNPHQRPAALQPKTCNTSAPSTCCFTYQRIANDRTFRAEVYQKNYTQLTTFDAANPYNPSAYQNAGSGYAQGLDVFWRDRKSLRRVDYWVSYGLLDTRRQYRTDPVPAVPTFAARHNLSVVGKYWMQKLHTQVGFTYSYGSPRAYHDPNQPGYNQGRTPSYQDLSLNAAYLTHLFGQFTIVYVSASNVLGRDNIYGYRYAATADASGQYRGVAVTPSAPRMLFVGVFISINKKTKGDVNQAPE